VGRLSTGSQAPPVERWTLGAPDPPAAGGIVALTFEEQALARERGLVAVPFHDVAAGGDAVAPAPAVDVGLPPYRGTRFAGVLSWLVTQHLATPGAAVTWRVERRHGGRAVATALAELGWSLEPRRGRRHVELAGAAPPPHELPLPRSFAARLGAHGVPLAADYGVFSAAALDDGSALLLDVALAGPDVAAVADVGTGYGALGIGLVLNGRAARAVATEVDAVAAWLARRNAVASGVDMAVRLDSSPGALPATPLTVCNVPTHLDAGRSRVFVAALARRARGGRLLAVVHASLEERYAQQLRAAGCAVTVHRGAHHVVLDTTCGTP
jgi:16S rRNA G1207 methylase RsmC